jgi:prepilin-type N-terminal cleavage/methylation domain-containing protein/prepilin-type processing-associated H-X9-DG protein
MQKKGFTLIELLVVMSVISVLMAVLVPVLARARQQGEAVMCLSNLRQLAIASQVYINENDGYYPIAYIYKPTDSVFICYAWDFISIKNWKTGEQKVTAGLLWQGTTIEKIQQCPSFKGSHNWFADPYTGYNYNTSYIGHGSGESIVMPAKAIQVKRPGNCALFGDGEYAGGANKFMRAPWPSQGDAQFSGRFAGTQGYRHCGKTNVAFCDGHAQSWAELYTKTDPIGKANLEQYNKNHEIKIGFLSPDNSTYDLK